MFVCIECGAIFENPKEWQETHGLDSGPYEGFSSCPYCGGNYTEAFRCDTCGDWITDGYIKIGNDRYCQDCYEFRELGDED